jgi:hypothetical protein
VTGAVRGEATLVVALALLLIAMSLMPPGGVTAAGELAALALTAIAWTRRAPAAASLGLLFVA